MTKLSMMIALFVVACLLLGPAGSAADQEVNLPDHDSPTLGDATSESEPSVAVFGSTIVVGWNDTRDPTSQWVSMGYAFSNDDGATFTNSGFLPPPPGYFYFGDPSLAVDRAGHFYFAALIIPSPPGPLGIAVSRSTSTNPLRFGPPKLITSPAGGSFDKEWIAVDTSGGTFDGRVYVAWTEFTGIDRPTSVFVTHSTRTSPLSFARPTALSEPDALNTGAMPAVGP
ncbi:MAG TPA: hypothetical protein VFQ80_16445, partial [Thermomicrobiales bacterium]|nr:hypothetical protein [Thermomicrobiales bacterium]